jgi:hypothetical protein
MSGKTQFNRLGYKKPKRSAVTVFSKDFVADVLSEVWRYWGPPLKNISITQRMKEQEDLTQPPDTTEQKKVKQVAKSLGIRHLLERRIFSPEWPELDIYHWKPPKPPKSEARKDFEDSRSTARMLKPDDVIKKDIVLDELVKQYMYNVAVDDEDCQRYLFTVFYKVPIMQLADLLGLSYKFERQVARATLYPIEKYSRKDRNAERKHHRRLWKEAKERIASGK